MKKQISLMTLWALAVVATFGLLSTTDTAVAFGADGFAGDPDQEIASLESGPIVRRQLLHRSGRLEIQPMVAFSANDAFIRNVLPGVGVSYFFNNTFGLGGSFTFGALQLDTSLRRNLELTVSESQLNSLSYSRFGWTADVGIIYVPLFGKFSVMNSFFTHYDLHFIGGMGLINDQTVAAVDTFEGDPVLSGVRPGGLIGGGLRFFLADAFALNLQVRNYIATRALISSGSASPQLGNSVVFSAGVGIYFPGEVRISR